MQGCQRFGCASSETFILLSGWQWFLKECIDADLIIWELGIRNFDIQGTGIFPLKRHHQLLDL